MEIEGEDGSRVEVGSVSKAVLGRGSGLSTNERTVSRLHVMFELGDQADPREVSFQVVGKNPVWVRRSGEESGREVEIFRRLEKGVLASGDWFCISTQNPVWFRLKERTGVEVDEDNFDISKIDPVKEFGFLVIAHEFDSYPVRKIKDARSWNWFLEEPQQDSEDDDESSESKKKSGRGKRKKKVGSRKGEDDDDWTGESEDDKQLVAKTRKVDRPKYSTRSTEGKKPRKNTERKKISTMKSTRTNEEDETLEGFIVDDDDEEQEEESDEEEEFTDKDDDDE